MSPHILIYLRVGEKTVRLADVLNGTARVYDSAELQPNTVAKLVFSIDGVEESSDVLLSDGVQLGDELISFSYL